MEGPTSTSRKSAYVLIGVIVFSLIAALFGHRSVQAAYNDCVEHGENVREALRVFRERTGHFPESLSELPREQLCGVRLLRGTILQYVPAKSGYVLYFNDGLVMNKATQADPFDPRK